MIHAFIISLFMAFLLIPLAAFSDDPPATPASITVGTAGGQPGWR